MVLLWAMEGVRELPNFGGRGCSLDGCAEPGRGIGFSFRVESGLFECTVSFNFELAACVQTRQTFRQGIRRTRQFGGVVRIGGMFEKMARG
jgi:hypothetical protein